MSLLKLLGGVGVLGACLLVTPPSLAQDRDQYRLVATLELETGEQIKMPFGYFVGYPDCYQAMKRQPIGRVIPRGLMIGADGSSPSATVLSVKCVLR